MPVIGRVKTRESIDERVQSTTLDKSGAGVVSSAWASLGKEAAAWGTELLKRQRDDESHAFRTEASYRGQIGAAEEHKRLLADLDPKTGKTKVRDEKGNFVLDEDGGFKLSENSIVDQALDLEKARMDRFIEKAPTTHAARAYAKQERERVSSRLVGLDNLRYKHFMADKTAADDNFYADALPKALASYDPSLTGQSRTKNTLKNINETEKNILNDPHYPLVVKKEKIKDYHFKQAVSSIESNILHNEIDEAISAIDMTKLWRARPEIKDQQEDILRRQGLLKDGDSLEINPNGMGWVVFQPDDPFSKNPTKGKILELGTGRVLVQNADLRRDIHDMEEIRVDGDINGLVDYITPEYQISAANRLARLVARNSKVNRAELNSRVQNLVDGLSSDQEGVKLRTTDPSVSVEIAGLFAELDAYPEHKKEFDRKKQDIIAASILGKTKDSHWMTDRKEFQKILKELPVALEYEASSLGMDTTPDELTSAKGRLVNQAKNWYGEAYNTAKNSIADYAYMNDSNYKALADRYNEFPKNLEQARANSAVLKQLERKSTAIKENMGIRDIDFEKGKFRSQMIDNQVSTLKRLKSVGDAPDGGDKYSSFVDKLRLYQVEHKDAFPEFMAELGKGNEIDPEVMFAMRMFRDDVVGRENFADLLQILNSGVLKDDTKTKLFDSLLEQRGKSRQDFYSEVYDKVQDITVGFQDSAINPAEGTKQSKALLGIIQQATADEMFRNQDSISDNVDRALERFFLRNKIVQKSGKDVMIVDKGDLARQGINPETTTMPIRSKLYYEKPEIARGNIDLAKSLQGDPRGDLLAEELKMFEKGVDRTGKQIRVRSVSPKERADFLWKLFEANNGEVVLTTDDNKGKFYYKVKFKDPISKKNRAIPAVGKDGKIWAKSYKDADVETAGEPSSAAESIVEKAGETLLNLFR